MIFASQLFKSAIIAASYLLSFDIFSAVVDCGSREDHFQGIGPWILRVERVAERVVCVFQVGVLVLIYVLIGGEISDAKGDMLRQHAEYDQEPEATV